MNENLYCFLFKYCTVTIGRSFLFDEMYNMLEKMSHIERIQIHCDCGICGHHTEKECVEKECKCCLNFHVRSGPKLNLHGKRLN